MPFVLRFVAYEHKLMLTVLPNDLACLNLHMLLDDSSISVKKTASTRLVEAVCVVCGTERPSPEVFTFLG